MKNVKWGQHFLVNPHIAKKMVQRFLPVEGPILEVGPGKGILTRDLIKYRQADNKITAVELDRGLCFRVVRPVRSVQKPQRQHASRARTAHLSLPAQPSP